MNPTTNSAALSMNIKPIVKSKREYSFLEFMDIRGKFRTGISVESKPVGYKDIPQAKCVESLTFLNVI